MAIVALLVLATMAVPAWADDDNTSAWGAQTLLDAPRHVTDGVADIDVVQLAGDEGESVFFTVKAGEDVQAELLAHRFDDFEKGVGSTATMVFRLQADLKNIDNYYHVTVFADRAGKKKLFSGTVQGVWASFESADGKSSQRALIGTRTVGDEGYASPTFNAPATLLYFEDGDAPEGDAGLTPDKKRAYGLVSSTPDAEGVFHYKAEATLPESIDGAVNYLDTKGSILVTDPIKGLRYDEPPRAIQIPTAIKVDDDAYRTLAFTDKVYASNPGQSSFAISCVLMSTADEQASGHYLENVNLVYKNDDGVSVLIANDPVNVKGNFRYTAPTSIYKNELVDGTPQVVAYSLIDEGVLELSPNREFADAGSHTSEVLYKRESQLPRELVVTFNLINGQERAQAGNQARLLGVKTATVSAKNPMAQPDELIVVDDVRYQLVGDASVFAYSYGSGAMPVVDAYYLPEGHEALAPYEVSVNYVDLATNQVIASETFESSPDDPASRLLATPESFVESGRTYVRLPGQEAGVSQSYWSDADAHVVYYRDSEEALGDGVVVNTVRFVFEEAPVAAPSDGGSANASGEDAEASVALRLDAQHAYHVMDGTGNRMLTTEAGVDTWTLRSFEETQQPMASLDLSQDAAGAAGLGLLLLAAGVGAFAAWRFRRLRGLGSAGQVA